MDKTDTETSTKAEPGQTRRSQPAEYLSILQHLSVVLFEAFTPDQILHAIMADGLACLNAAAGSICLLTDDGAQLETVRSFGYPPQASSPPARFALDTPSPLAEAARTGQSVFLPSVSEYHARYLDADHGCDPCTEEETFAAIPLQIQGQLMGVLGVTYSGGGVPGPDERAFLETVARLGALALERQRLSDSERQATEATRQLEEKLKAEKEGESTRARNFFDNLTDGMVAYSREWRVLYANEAAAAACRLRLEEFEGKVVWDLFPELQETAYADACRQVMNDHVPAHRKDYWPGSDIWFENHIFPTETGIAVMFRDITERKRAEEALALQARLLETVNDLFLQLANENEPETILESVVSTVVRALNIDGCTMTEIDIEQDKAEILYAYSEGQSPLTGTHAISDMITPEWIGWYQQGKTRVVEDAFSDVHARPFHEKYYTPMHIGALISVPFLRSGRWMGNMGVYTRGPRKWLPQEIAFAEAVGQRAWLILANARLFQAERERSEQLSLAILEVHHRVKNNLQAVSALLEMQLSPAMAVLPVEAVLDSLSQIKTIALVHDLLARDRPIGAVNLAQVLVNLAGLLSSGMRRTEHPLRIQVDADPLWLSTKAATSLSLAVNELLTNAMKHYKHKEREGIASHAAIKVRLERQNGNVLVAVQDYGPGFPPGFDPDLHANLGLQLVLTLVEHDLHGRVSFTNHFDPGDGRQPAGGRVEITFAEQSLPE